MKVRLLAFVCMLAFTACSAAAPHASFGPSPGSHRAKNSRAAFVFAVKGDWGAGTRAQRDVTAEMCAIRKTRPFRYVVTTGDNFYNPDGIATRSNFYDPERCLIAYRGNTWRAVWGNHDVAGTSTATVLGSPQKYYTWSVGATQFFMLDANIPADATQRAWLEHALSSSRAQVKIVVFHQPAFTSGLHTDDSGVQRNWVPLFVRYHITLVLTGHNHDYEHLKVDGIDYVVSGGGGQTSYPCLRVEPGALRCASAYHFLLVTVSSGTVTVEAVRPSGGLLDRFEIQMIR